MRIWGRLEVSLLLAGIRYQSGMRGFPEQRLEARLVGSGTPPHTHICSPIEKARLGLEICVTSR